MPEERLGLSPICLCGCGQEVGHCESLILYRKDLYIFVKVSQVSIFYSSLDTFININTTPKGGAPAQAEYTSKKERRKKDCARDLVRTRGSGVVRQRVGLQTLWQFRLIYWWGGRGLMLWLVSGPPGFSCWVSLLRNSVLFTVESISLLYLLFISWFICSWRWCIDKLGVFHANQTSMCLDPHLN